MKSTSPAPGPQVCTQTIPRDLENEKRNYIAQNFEVIEWVEPPKAHIICPGQDLHSTPSSGGHTTLFTDGCPTIHCFHESCSEKVAETNRRLRATFDQITYGRPSRLQKPYLSSSSQKKRSKNDSLKEAGERSKNLILERYSCSLSDFCGTSPYSIPSDPMEQFRLQLGVYSQGKNETIFHGGLHDSNHPRHRGNFLSEAEWKTLPEHLGEFISQSSYEKGCYRRTKDSLRRRLVYVVECDEVDPGVQAKISQKEELTDEDKIRNKEASCAIYRWMKEEVGMRLLWVVDSGNKSLHAAFEVPDKETLRELEVILPAFGADSSMIKDNQLTRAAGAQRGGDGPIQELLYCDPVKP